MESSGAITLTGTKITVIGKETVGMSTPRPTSPARHEAKFGVGNQNIVYEHGQGGTQGAAINSSATGKHEITGAVVKIN